MSKRVLIAEDEESIVVSLDFLMHSSGFETCVVRDGARVIDLVAAFRPHLLLLDIMLPGTSGLAICRALRADPVLRDTSILMLTAMGGRNDAARGLECGADDYVVKPFSTRDLLARARALVAAQDRR
jgi:DNA-binding response OmpR family regulator